MLMAFVVLRKSENSMQCSAYVNCISCLTRLLLTCLPKFILSCDTQTLILYFDFRFQKYLSILMFVFIL